MTRKEMIERFWELQEPDLEAYTKRIDQLLGLLSDEQVEQVVGIMEGADPDELTPITDWANDVFLTEHDGIEACYIAIMPQPDGNIDLEIEISEGTIGATYPTEQSDLEVARKLANELEIMLEDEGIKVFQNREEWDDFLAAPDAE